jgi:Spx/MgsR family transcriptional regulator
MITVFGIRNCDTIKKTRKWLTANGYPHSLHDYRVQGIDAGLVEQLLRQFTLEQLINRRGTTWRTLPESSKQHLDQQTASRLLCDNPALIKRPIPTDGRHWLIGFDPQAIATTLKS